MVGDTQHDTVGIVMKICDSRCRVQHFDLDVGIDTQTITRLNQANFRSMPRKFIEQLRQQERVVEEDVRVSWADRQTQQESIANLEKLLLANDAKANCPISKLLNAEITLTINAG